MAGRLEADLWIQAAAERVIDFSEVKFGDWRWKTRVDMLADYLHRKNTREHLNMLRDEQVAYLGSSMISAKSFMATQELVSDLTERIHETYYPSAEEKDETATRQELRTQIAKDVSDWEVNFGGKIDDPKIVEEVNRVAAALESLRGRTATMIGSQPAGRSPALHS